MAAAQYPTVAFLAVVRISDGAFLAARFHKGTPVHERTNFEVALEVILQRAKKLACPNWKDHCASAKDGSGGMVHAVVDAQACCFCAVGVRAVQYPERVAQQMLSELAEQVKGSRHAERLIEAKAGDLTAPLKRSMQALMKDYHNPATKDRIGQVQEKVASLHCVMQDNVRQILETHASTAALEASSKSMTETAQEFIRQSSALKRNEQRRNLKVKAIAIGSVVLLLGFCTLSIIDKFNG